MPRPSYVLCRNCGDPVKVGRRGLLPSSCSERCKKALWRAKRKKKVVA